MTPAICGSRSSQQRRFSSSVTNIKLEVVAALESAACSAEVRKENR